METWQLCHVILIIFVILTTCFFFFKKRNVSKVSVREPLPLTNFSIEWLIIPKVGEDKNQNSLFKLSERNWHFVRPVYVKLENFNYPSKPALLLEVKSRDPLKVLVDTKNNNKGCIFMNGSSVECVLVLQWNLWKSLVAKKNVLRNAGQLTQALWRTMSLNNSIIGHGLIKWRVVWVSNEMQIFAV